MTELPTKIECMYILEMIDSRLIDFSYTHPWADKLIEQMDAPPPWLCDLACRKYKGDQLKALREYVYSEPFVSSSLDFEKFYVACLYLRYERRELSWATFLKMAGTQLDAACADWACEVPYHYLNLYEDAYFSEAAELDTKQQYFQEHDLRPWIELARERFDPFHAISRLKKAK